ncbi:hypothetical protein MGG_17447 [Pyricularia oryzae 70-15]|uniref:Uncharacterized protein n=3 Tax=Pyricularia oryzae TaxID=318829 RepID=G4NBS7_PYRO7|nr:uncharacterized protein MGG_17447 [Pyricularia oryzae 70-15]EHA48985.1 hypothetical protein MGG_17447 [Pyricularia oryzae 70-15]ELQ42531.1 hypothetical protein OOU_Y34scaffold00203g20 [Pyricularia oryzae Y34]
MARIVVIRDRGGERRNSGRSLGNRGSFYLAPVRKRGTSPSFGQVATCVRNIPGWLWINGQPAEAMIS